MPRILTLAVAAATGLPSLLSPPARQTGHCPLAEKLMSPALKLALPIAVLLAIPAQAQLLGMSLWESNVALTQSDIDMIRATLAQKIHNRPPGVSASWINPISGNSGSVTLLNASVRQDRRCEQIEYRINPPQSALPSDRYVLGYCMQPDGTWKLS